MIPKEELLKDFKIVFEKYKSENQGSIPTITRDYYRQNGSYTDAEICEVFGSFSNFKSDFLEEEGLEFEVEKKLTLLQEENKQLKKDKEKLIKKSIDEEDIINLYKEKRIYIKAPIKLSIPKTHSSNTAQAILMLSDLHCGQYFEAEEVNNLNAYSVDIMKERLDRVFYYFVYYCQKFSIKKINIFFLGDLWANSHHRELDRTNSHNEVEVLFILHEYFTDKILSIESHFDKISCEFLVGNHGRILEGRPYYQEAAVMNWEYILARQLRIQFNAIQKDNSSKKIDINVSPSLSKIVEVSGRKFLLTHSITQGGGSSFGSIPYYAVDRTSAKKFGIFYQMGDADQLFDDILSAHLHSTYKTKTISGYAYGNGCVVGPDPFSLEKLKVASEPEQTMLIVDRGIVVQEMILKCNNPFKG